MAMTKVTFRPNTILFPRTAENRQRRRRRVYIVGGEERGKAGGFNNVEVERLKRIHYCGKRYG